MKMNKKGVMFGPFLVVFVLLLSIYAIFVSLDNIDFEYNDHLTYITKMSMQADLGIWYWEKAAERVILEMLKEYKCVKNDDLNMECINKINITDYFNKKIQEYHFNYYFDNDKCEKPQYMEYYTNKGEESLDRYKDSKKFQIKYLDSFSYTNYPQDILCNQYNIYIDDRDIIGYSKFKFHIETQQKMPDGKMFLISKTYYYPHFHLYVDDIITKYHTN